LTPAEDRQQVRIRLIAWALLAGGGALIIGLVIGLAIGLEPGLRSGGSGFFYGLLAFHLQRVDPDDGHLQAGLVVPGGGRPGAAALASPAAGA
jgi:hypothetical protein